MYCLATEKEKQTEALKNKEQNQLDKYRALIQKQMKKERAFLSYKKIEFLSRQEAKFGGKRTSLSAGARMVLVARTEAQNLAPFIFRQRTHLGMVVASSKPRSTNLKSSRRQEILSDDVDWVK